MKNWKAITGAILTLLLLIGQAQANILWMGAEDIDFPNGAGLCGTSGSARGGYGRTLLRSCSGVPAVSTTFPGGAITSGWLSFRGYDCATNLKFAGFITNGTQNSLWIGTDGTDNTKVVLFKYDGTTWTPLATSATGVVTCGGVNKYDMQLINYGASATVNVYVGGSANAAITYTGNVAVGTNTNFNAVGIIGNYWTGGISELIVSDVDSRSYSLVTLAPNAAGTTNQWTGSYTNINPTWINDSSFISDATANDVFEAKLNSLPSGTGAFTVQGVKVIARALKTGSGIGSLSIGTYTNSALSVPSPISLSGGWGSYETYYSTNPVTSTNWTTTDITNLQIGLQSAP